MFLGAVTLPLHVTFWAEIHPEILQALWNSNLLNQDLCGTRTECYFSNWSSHISPLKLIIFALFNIFFFTSFSNFHHGTYQKKAGNCQMKAEQTPWVVWVCCVREHFIQSSCIQSQAFFIQSQAGEYKSILATFHSLYLGIMASALINISNCTRLL